MTHDQGHLVLPRGTRVVLERDRLAENGQPCPAGSPAKVDEVDHPAYVVVTPAGTRVPVHRDDLRIQKKEVADALIERADAWARYEPRVVLAVVVGSTAWGLAGASSDRDLKGAFLLPFDDHCGLLPTPTEIRAADTDAQYHEVEALMRHALDADANALETLWAPEVVHQTEVGQWLREARDLFISQRVYRAFGRYAMSQLDKLRQQARAQRLEAAVVDSLRQHPDLTFAALATRLTSLGLVAADPEARRSIDRLARSLFDRDLTASAGFDALRAFAIDRGDLLLDAHDPAGAKNVYNLIRLLHSGIHALEHGEPLVRIEPDRPDGLREHLLAIKRRELPLDAVLAEAESLAEQLERAYAHTALPELPDLARADALLKRCRRHAAREALREG